jgi:hypothetical protein
MGSTIIDFGLEGIGAQLQQRLLAVPIYQRPYSWKEEQVVEFWTDLRAAFGKKIPEYFLGTIVLSQQGNVGRETIIDGQQRLATTLMVLAAIRNEYEQRGDGRRAAIVQNTYISVTELKSGEQVARLRLSSEDDPYFRKLVIENDRTVDASRKSHERIMAALTVLESKLRQLTTDAGAEWTERLVNMVEFLRAQVQTIVLEVPTEADAFLIFETLNDRGADLTIADLLKNYLFGRAGTQIDTVRNGWLEAVGALEIAAENATFTMFLKHYWSSRKGIVRERELYKNIRENVATETQAVEFIQQLQSAARLYAALLNSDHEHWSMLGTEAKENVESFLRLELEQVRPLMLAAMQHFSAAELKKLLRALTSWGVRGLIVGGIGGGTYEKAYCDAAVKIRSGALKSTDDVFGDLSKLVPTDEEFEAEFAVARVPKPNLARYYLIALENSAKGEKEPELVPNANEDQVNLEHILPKNATDTDWGKAFKLDERADWVFRVGNLSLLQKGPNGRIGNKAFSVKKPILGASSFVLTKEAGAAADWTPQAIQKRQERLAKLALGVWPRKPV